MQSGTPKSSSGIFVRDIKHPLVIHCESAFTRESSPPEAVSQSRADVAKDAAESGHTFDFDNVRVIDTDQGKGGRLLHEAWHTGSNSSNRYTVKLFYLPY